MRKAGNTLTNIMRAPVTWTGTATGNTSPVTTTCGRRTRVRAGCPTPPGTGYGSPTGDGPGSPTSPGAGRHITTAAGSAMATLGCGGPGPYSPLIVRCGRPLTSPSSVSDSAAAPGVSALASVSERVLGSAPPLVGCRLVPTTPSAPGTDDTAIPITWST